MILSFKYSIDISLNHLFIIDSKFSIIFGFDSNNLTISIFPNSIALLKGV